jgi:circadian clock protein KaiC
MRPNPNRKGPERVSTGVPGLDDIFGGGFPAEHIYLVEGDPGAGKTTLALQFLLDGARKGEPCVYVLLSETRAELEAVAASHGWSLDGIEVVDLQGTDGPPDDTQQYTFFHPAEVELSETTKVILEAVDRVKPRRAVFDSMSEMRLLARDQLRYRRQVLSLKKYFTEIPSTVLLLDYNGTDVIDHQLESLCHGVLRLEQLAPKYGGQRRQLRLQKLRGSVFRDGYHDFTIRTGGIVIHPRLVAGEHAPTLPNKTLSSGIAELDALVRGGLDYGTSTLILGPAGVGKSTIAAQYVVAAARGGQRAAVYTFDETPSIFTIRGESLGMDVRAHLERGNLRLKQLDPAEQSPGEFATMVRSAVEELGARVIVIDSLNGYLSAMPEEHSLQAHLHQLLAYLNHMGVATILVVSQTGILGNISSPIELSYLADTVILLRYFEATGAVRKAISVLKRRTGPHEDTIRELRVGPRGIQVGRALNDFQGVLSGQLVYTGVPNGDSPLLKGS